MKRSLGQTIFFAIFGTFGRYVTNLRCTFVENIKKVQNQPTLLYRFLRLLYPSFYVSVESRIRYEKPLRSGMKNVSIRIRDEKWLDPDLG
jgi:hypothetical protein